MEEAKRLESDGWTYTLEATFLEIYNETVRDLLASSAPTSKAGLPIKMDEEGNAHVPGLNKCKIEDRSSIEALMKKANKRRSVAHTDMNSQSSRSHSVFTLHLIGKNESQGVVVKGCLNLCDLAGSERLSRSGAVFTLPSFSLLSTVRWCSFPFFPSWFLTLFLCFVFVFGFCVCFFVFFVSPFF